MKQKFLAIFLLFLTAIIWGFAFVAQVLGGDHLEALTFNGIRFIIGAVSLIPVYCIFEKESDLSDEEKKARHKRTLIASLIVGTILFIASGLQQVGTNITRDPGKSGFITGLYTALTPILYLIIFRKKSPWNTWIGVVCASVGLYMLCYRPENGTMFGIGELVLFIGAFFWAGHILAVDKFVDRVSLLRFSSWQFFVCGAENLIFSLFFEHPDASGFKGALIPLLYCGILSVGVAFTCQNIAQRMSSPTFAAIVFSTESVFAAIGGVLWNLITPDRLHVDQEISTVGYIGCAIIFIGIVLSQIDLTGLFKRKKTQKSNIGG